MGFSTFQKLSVPARRRIEENRAAAGPRRFLAAALSVGFAASAGYGADGVTEISQAKILAGGGFPYVIDTPGSYVLTSNLDVRTLPGPHDITAIEITADHVSLDLGGFAILGPASCSVVVPICPPGSGIGVNAFPEPAGVRVRNGTIQGMGSWGLRLGDRAVVEDLIVRNNVNHGIDVGSFSRVVGNVSRENLGDGIRAASGVLLVGNVSANNLDHGIDSSAGVVIRENTVIDNGEDGIETSNDSLVVGNTATGNGGDGIHCLGSATARDNTATGNGADGIDIGSGVLIGNTASSNIAFDLNMGGTTKTGYANNSVSSSAEISGGLQLGQNLCGAELCP